MFVLYKWIGFKLNVFEWFNFVISKLVIILILLECDVFGVKFWKVKMLFIDRIRCW